MDVLSLLGRMEQLSAELCSIKHTMQLHANIGDDLRNIIVDINRRVSALERSTDLKQGDSPEVSAVMGRDTRLEGWRWWKPWMWAPAREPRS